MVAGLSSAPPLPSDHEGPWLNGVMVNVVVVFLAVIVRWTYQSLAWLVLWSVFDLVLCVLRTVCTLRSWMSAWVRLLIGGVDPLFLDPSDGVFGRFDLAALCGCRTLNFCLFMMKMSWLKWTVTSVSFWKLLSLELAPGFFLVLVTIKL